MLTIDIHVKRKKSYVKAIFDNTVIMFFCYDSICMYVCTFRSMQVYMYLIHIKYQVLAQKEKIKFYNGPEHVSVSHSDYYWAGTNVIIIVCT